MCSLKIEYVLDSQNVFSFIFSSLSAPYVFSILKTETKNKNKKMLGKKLLLLECDTCRCKQCFGNWGEKKQAVAAGV